jgi:orotidine-5'-phosphate decarboxylase
MPTRNALHMLAAAITGRVSRVCCGLDPDPRFFPAEIRQQHPQVEQQVREFLHAVVNTTAPHVCAYKIQKAFFDCLPDGSKLLREIISYIQQTFPDIPVFVDCKIGDTMTTMEVYLRNLLERSRQTASW